MDNAVSALTLLSSVRRDEVWQPALMLIDRLTDKWYNWSTNCLSMGTRAECIVLRWGRSSMLIPSIWAWSSSDASSTTIVFDWERSLALCFGAVLATAVSAGLFIVIVILSIHCLNTCTLMYSLYFDYLPLSWKIYRGETVINLWAR